MEVFRAEMGNFKELLIAVRCKKPGLVFMKWAEIVVDKVRFTVVLSPPVLSCPPPPRLLSNLAN